MNKLKRSWSILSVEYTMVVSDVFGEIELMMIYEEFICKTS